MTEKGLYFGHSISPVKIRLQYILQAMDLPRWVQFALLNLAKFTRKDLVELFPPNEFAEANAELRAALKRISGIAVKDFEGYSPDSPQKVFRVDTELVIQQSILYVFDMSIPSTGTGEELGLALRPILDQYGYEGNPESRSQVLIVYAEPTLMGTYTSSMVRGAAISGCVDVRPYHNFEQRNTLVQNWVREQA